MKCETVEDISFN